MQLETGRLILRECEPGDYADLREIDGDLEVQRYRDGHTVPAEQRHAWIERTQTLRQETPRRYFPLIIALIEDGEVIGACLFNFTDVARREAEIGYLIKRRHWGQGYTTEAVRAVLAFGFGTLGLHRVWAKANPENIGSWRVMEKLGMRREGHLREADLTATGEWRDVYLYAILDHEWRGRVEGTDSSLRSE